MKNIIGVTIIVLIVIGYFLYEYYKADIREFLDVDACLDHGGRWMKELKKCEYE